MNDQPPDQPDPNNSDNSPQPPMQGLPGFPAELQRKFLAQVKFDNNQVAAVNIISTDHVGALIHLAGVLSNCTWRVKAINFEDQTSDSGILSATGVPIHMRPGPRNRLR